MPRNGLDVYALPAGTAAVSGATANSTHVNSRFTDLETDANTVRPIVAGGTGASSASGARTNLGLGSMALQGQGGVNITGGTISGVTVSSTTISSLSADLAVADGGTGASSASAARTNLGLGIGTDILGFDADLKGIADLTWGNGDLITKSGGTVSVVSAGAAGTLLIGKGAGTAPEYLAAGTSGQYLRSNGAADPSWITPPTTGTTLLATVSAASGTTITASSLDLTPYKFLQVVVIDVSASTTSTTLRIANQIMSDILTNQAETWTGGVTVDLTDGVFWGGAMSLSGSAQTVKTANSSISTATTSISFTLGAGNFDGGSIKIYGVP